jgi:hypothetical protein
MAGDTSTINDVDPIRVVPLHLPDELYTPLPGAPAATPPALTYRGGPLLTAVEVFTIFWGAAWEQPPQSGLAQSVNAYFDFILTSALMDQLGEYSVSGQTIAHGRRTGSITLTTPAPKPVVSDSSIQRMLQAQIGSNASFPRPTPNTLYFVYLPPGVTLTQGGGRSCMTFCGYHSDITGRIFYGAMPFPGCAGCTGGLAALDALTSTSSHELCEAITDAIPGQGWYDDANGEIGDICAWKTKKLGAYTIQLEWSNRQNSCV